MSDSPSTSTLTRLRRRLTQVLPETSFAREKLESFDQKHPEAGGVKHRAPAERFQRQKDASEVAKRVKPTREDLLAYWKPAPSQLATEEKMRRQAPYFQPEMRGEADAVKAELAYRRENALALREQALQEQAEKRELDKLKARLGQVRDYEAAGRAEIEKAR